MESISSLKKAMKDVATFVKEERLWRIEMNKKKQQKMSGNLLQSIWCS